MNAGSLTDSIEVWRNTGVKDAYGEVQDSWSKTSDRRAQVISQNMRRAMNSGEVWYPRAVVFKVRTGLDVTASDRIQWNGQQYDIVSIVENRLDQSITINTELHND